MLREDGGQWHRCRLRAPPEIALGSRVWGLEFRVWGLGFMVEGLVCFFRIDFCYVSYQDPLVPSSKSM